MKKIPCLFVRKFHADGTFTITDEVTPGCLWVFQGEGVATRKWDGTACLWKDGKLWGRYDAKHGKTPPPGWVACQPEPDPTTGHHPGWVPVDENPKWKHHRAGLANRLEEAGPLTEGATYELIGPGVQGNPEQLEGLTLVPHGGRPSALQLDLRHALEHINRTFEGLRAFLGECPIEGIVFHHPDGRMAKIRRHDFGFPWGAKKGRAA